MGSFKFKAQEAVREKIAVKIALMSPSGGGKAIIDSAIIPTPNGDKRMGDIKVGDFVFDRLGNPTEVLGVYPQGEKEVFKVTLSDGREVLCNDEHLWSYYSTKTGKLRTESLREMLNRGIKDSDNGNRYKIPTNEPVKYAEKELPVDPYVFGSMLGNGCLTESALTLSSNDIENVEKVADKLNAIPFKTHHSNYSWKFERPVKDYRANNNKFVTYYQTCEIMGDFYGKKSGDKFIPDVYKKSSVEQRYELIRGLMDTDGYIEDNAPRFSCSYSTVSKQLAADVMEVLYSLGYSASISEDSREGRNTCYEVNVLVDNACKELLFSTGHKNERAIKAKAYDSRRNYGRISIVDVEDMGCTAPMTCIYVDNEEHLFLANDYVVTHNTYSALRMADGMIRRMKELNSLNGTNGKILFANTEASRGRYYANEFKYDIVDLTPPFNPELFVDLIDYAIDSKYSVLIIDSSSAEWEGKGGCLELQQLAGGKYQDWGKISPRHDAFINKLSESPIHIIATMKGKDQYEVEKDERGRTSVKKLGVGAKQREGFEYYFTTTFTIDRDTHTAKCEKDNTHIFEDAGIVQLTERFGEKIIDWAESGEVENQSEKRLEAVTGTDTNVNELSETIEKIGNCAKAMVAANKISKEDLVKIITTHHSSANYNTISDVNVALALLAELESVSK